MAQLPPLWRQIMFHRAVIMHHDYLPPFKDTEDVPIYCMRYVGFCSHVHVLCVQVIKCLYLRAYCVQCCRSLQNMQGAQSPIGTYSSPPKLHPSVRRPVSLRVMPADARACPLLDRHRNGQHWSWDRSSDGRTHFFRDTCRCLGKLICY